MNNTTRFLGRKLGDWGKELSLAFTDDPIGYDVYMTRCSIAIDHFHELLDMAMERIINNYPGMYREGMTKRELAYKIITKSHA